MTVKGIEIKLVEPSEEFWNKFKEDIVRIETQAFPDYAFTEDYLHKHFLNNDNILLAGIDKNPQRLIAFMYAVPITFWYPQKESEKNETMHIDDVVIDKNYQGKGLIKYMSALVEDEMRKRGYKYFETQAAINNGYDKKIEHAYRGRIVSGPERTPLEEDSQFGERMNFKIKL